MAIEINEVLRDDELRSILAKLESEQDKEAFGLVCKRWLHLQSTERRNLSARAGHHMLRRMAARFSRLRELDLSQSVSRSYYPGISDSDLSVIAEGFASLRLLNLQNCKGITDKGIMAIGGGLSSLQSLDLSYCRKLTDKGLVGLAEGCSDLRRLHLNGCRLLTNCVLQALSKNCPNLEELGLQGCTNITDSGLTDLVTGCRRIKFLDVNKCSSIGEIGISSISEACATSLKTLKLLDCYKIGDQAILSLARFCSDLETLIIGGCRNVTDESIKSLATACNTSLKNLRMDWCLNISDSALSVVLANCRKLEILDIGCCEKMTDAAFLGLSGGETKPNLKALKVSNCPKITVAGIGTLLQECKCLDYLDVRSCPRITKACCDEAGLQFPDRCKVNFNGSLSEPDVLI